MPLQQGAAGDLITGAATGSHCRVLLLGCRYQDLWNLDTDITAYSLRLETPYPFKYRERRGKAMNCSYISTPPSETDIKKLPKEVGGVPYLFSIFGLKILFNKRWERNFIY